jgi:hypothetical protein
MTYDGEMVNALYASADRTIAESRQLRGEIILQDAARYLRDRQQSTTWPLDEDDCVASWMLDELELCVRLNQTRICFWCNEMEGLHSAGYNACRKQNRLKYGTSGGMNLLSNTFEAWGDDRRA